jgi:YegS/Rv2252/BmrU family lipid kinase
MRACVIFNPVAKGEKARQFRASLETLAKECTLKKTAAAGDARRLAAEAIREGFELIVAAGGDGTLNEVLNGFADAPDGFQRACLSVLPLGTVNVFARELKIPLAPDAAWAAIRSGREIRVDLPYADFTLNGKPERRYFAQLAGAGLDARAIELVSWSLKKKIGPLAYIVAGLKALTEKRPLLTASHAMTSLAGELILIGNGRLYGGDYEILPRADLRNGQLEVCVFPRANWFTLARCGPPLLLRGRLPERAVRRFQAAEFSLTCDSAAAFELDGELVGHLPVKFSIAREALRVLAP